MTEIPPEVRKQASLELDRRRAKEDCVFFIDNYLMTFDPRATSYPHHLNFKTYDFQRELVQEVIIAMSGETDLFVEKSRTMGASWTVLAVILWGWLFLDGFQALLGSRKEDYVDKAGDISALFQKIDYMITRIKDPLLLPEGFRITSEKYRTRMKILNPINGNAIVGESSNANFGRAGRYRIALLDELGFWPDDKSAWASCSESSPCRIAITTPPDHPTWTKTHRFSGKAKVVTYHWSRHPEKDDAWYEYQKTKKTEEEMLHEIDISWEYSSTGRPYPDISSIQIEQYPYNDTAPLYISIDLGLDAVALGWYQPIPNTDWTVLIEAFEASGHIIDWYLPFFGKDFDDRFTYTQKDLEFIKQVRQWKEPEFFGDPSGKQRHIESGIAPYSILYDHGIRVQVNDRENEWIPRRDATRKLITRLAMNDNERTRWWLECMKNAHYPKRDENSQAVTGITKPVHDWTSHHRTQTEFFAVNYKKADELVLTPKQRLNQAEIAFMDTNGKMVGAEIDVARILHDANRRRR